MRRPASAGRAGASERPRLSIQVFRLFHELIYKEAGIFLPPGKQALVERRLASRLRELGLRSYLAYFRRVRRGDREELVEMLNRISTNETSFFREPKQWQLLETQIVEGWKQETAERKRPKVLRAWSAACSSGEEPYSLAMVLLHHFPRAAGWDVRILATDISSRMLERARSATWPVERASAIPDRYLKTFMLRGTGSRLGQVRAGPEIRSAVRFARLNLNRESYALEGPFDLILCRNVLIYFDHDSKVRVIRRLQRMLRPKGYLFVGHAESMVSLAGGMDQVIPTVYQRSGQAPVSRCEGS